MTKRLGALLLLVAVVIGVSFISLTPVKDDEEALVTVQVPQVVAGCYRNFAIVKTDEEPLIPWHRVPMWADLPGIWVYEIVDKKQIPCREPV